MSKRDFEIGLIKWFDGIKGFGIIVSVDNKEFFIHSSNIVGHPIKILPATPFIFQIGIPKDGKSHPAINARIPSTQEDFNNSLRLLGKKREIAFDVKVRGKSRWGNPYVKVVNEKFDILKYYLFKILNEKSKDEVYKLFHDAFNENISHWDFNELIDFYAVTKERLRAIKITTSESGDSDDKILGAAYYLTKDLIDYYNSRLPIEYLINIWQAGESGPFDSIVDDFRPNNDFSENLPFDEKNLIDHIDLIKSSGIKRLNHFMISDQIKKQVFDFYFTKQIDTYEVLCEKIRLFQYWNIGKEYFERIVASISTDLLFEIWNSKKVFIDFDKKDFRFYYSKDKDYIIPKELLINNIQLADFKLISRISEIYDESVTLELLNERYKNFEITSENVLDELKSIERLSPEGQSIIFKKYYSLLIENHFATLIENKYLKITSKDQYMILSQEFNLQAELSKAILQIVTASPRIIPSEKRNILLKLDKDYYDSFVLHKVSEYTDLEKLSLLRVDPEFDLFILISSNWQFESIDSTKSLLEIGKENKFDIPDQFWKRFPEKDEFSYSNHLIGILQDHLNERIIKLAIKSLNFNLPESISEFFTVINPVIKEYKKEIGEAYNKQIEEISIENIHKIFNLLSENEIDFNITDLRCILRKPFKMNELVPIISLHSTLKGNDYQTIELILTTVIEESIEDTDDTLLELISKTNSIAIFQTLSLKCENLDDKVQYLTILKNSEITGYLSDDFLMGHLKKFVADYPIEVIDVAIENKPNLYDYVANQVILNKTIFISFLQLLLIKGELIKPYCTEKNDLNIIVSNFFNPNERKNQEALQLLFNKYYFAFQSDYIKFILYRFYKSEITRDQLNKIISGFNFVELSALMLSGFILNRVNTRDELMDLMNQLLKEHFNQLIINENIDSSFKNIFSINNLVKKCNGRKSYSGLTFWKGGNITRWYTNGYHQLTTGRKENIYCEGRFWKSQPFYNSDTNKPSTENNNFYWCKNDMCAGVNETVDFQLDFDKWTLVEVNELLKVNLDRLAFTHLAGWLNRMQTILDKLKCHQCGNYLRPKQYKPLVLGYYAVPLFHCIYENCSMYLKEIRFTHCRGCGKILDSRECITCNSCKWLICDDESCKKCGCGAGHTPIIAEYDY